MTKFVAVEKMSKKAKKAYYAKKRNVWGFDPSTKPHGKSNHDYKAKKEKMRGI